MCIEFLEELLNPIVSCRIALQSSFIILLQFLDLSFNLRFLVFLGLHNLLNTWLNLWSSSLNLMSFPSVWYNLSAVHSNSFDNITILVVFYELLLFLRPHHHPPKKRHEFSTLLLFLSVSSPISLSSFKIYSKFIFPHTFSLPVRWLGFGSTHCGCRRE